MIGDRKTNKTGQVEAVSTSKFYTSKIEIVQSKIKKHE